MRLVLALVLCVFLISCRAAVQASAAGAEPPTTAAKTSLQLIAEASERGEIDGDQATLYAVYAVKASQKLPLQYRGTAPMKDGTAVLRVARDRFPTLRPEIQDLLRPYLFPKGEQ